MTANRNAALVGEDLEKFGLQSGKIFAQWSSSLLSGFGIIRKSV